MDKIFAQSRRLFSSFDLRSSRAECISLPCFNLETRGLRYFSANLDTTARIQIDIRADCFSLL